MNSPANSDDQLLAHLLRQIDQASDQGPGRDHLDGETLASFAAGALIGEEWQHVIEHLDSCPGCRRSASLLISAADPAGVDADHHLRLTDGHRAHAGQENIVDVSKEPVTLRPIGWSWDIKSPSAFWALAAVLLIAVGSVLFWSGQNSQREGRAYDRALAMLETGKFDQVQQTVAEAKRSGINSDRLRNLEAEAVRGIPAVLALAYAGRLSNFGYDIGGVVARDPTGLPHRSGLTQAEQILQETGQTDLPIILNRGHTLLSLDRPQESRAEFERAVEMAPGDPLAWLGLGLACFLQDDFEAAESAFQMAVGLDKHSIAAHINLAMTLEERGKRSAALAEWRNLLKLPLTELDRKKIELAIEQLSTQTEKPELEK